MVQICAARVVRGRPSVLEVHGQTANRSARRKGVPLCARLAGMPVTKKERQLSLSLSFLVTGNVLPSQVVSNSVLSAQKGLTAVFGMGTGVSPSPLSPVSLNVFFAHSQLHSIFSLARHSLVM